MLKFLLGLPHVMRGRWSTLPVP